VSIIFDTESLTAMTCWVCGVRFALPTKLWDYWNANGKDGGFYCPNKCHLGVGESRACKAEKEAAALRAKLDQERMESSTARLERDKAQKAVKRLRTRAKAGVCAHCNRTFTNVARHMACKHAGVKP